MLLLPGSSPWEVLLTITVVLLGLGIFQVGFVGCLMERLTLIERAMAIASGIGLIAFAVNNQFIYAFGALLLLASVVFLNLLKRKKASLALVTAPASRGCRQMAPWGAHNL